MLRIPLVSLVLASSIVGMSSAAENTDIPNSETTQNAQLIFKQLQGGNYQVVWARFDKASAGAQPVYIFKEAWERTLALAGENYSLEQIVPNSNAPSNPNACDIILQCTWSRLRIHLVFETASEISRFVIEYEPDPADVIDPRDQIAIRAVKFISLVSIGDVTLIRSQLDTSIPDRMDAQTLVADVKSRSMGLGPVKQIAVIRHERIGDWDVVKVKCEFASTAVIYKILFNAQGQVSRCLFVGEG